MWFSPGGSDGCLGGSEENGHHFGLTSMSQVVQILRGVLLEIDARSVETSSVFTRDTEPFPVLPLAPVIVEVRLLEVEAAEA